MKANVLYVGDLRDIDAVFNLSLRPNKVLVADLVLGSWKPHSVAHDLSLQLGLPWATPTPGPVGSPQLDPISRLLDAQLQEDSLVRAAYQHARRIARRLRTSVYRQLLVLAPKSGGGWGRENEACVYFLLRMLNRDDARGGQNRAGFKVVIGWTGCGEPTLPGWLTPVMLNSRATRNPAAADCLVGRLPGLVEIASVARLPAGEARYILPLNDRVALIDPAVRRDASQTPPDEIRKLFAAFPPTGWLRAYATIHGQAEVDDPSRLRREAWEIFQQRGDDAALQLVDYCAARARTETDRAAAVALGYGLRIARRRYDEVGSEYTPSPSLPRRLRGSIMLNQAWSLAMRKLPAAASSLVQQALDLLALPADDPLALYIANIRSYNCFVQGDWPGASAIQQQLTRRLDACGSAPVHLRFLNALNSSRLNERQGRFAEASDELQRALAVVGGCAPAAIQIQCLWRAAELAERQGLSLPAFRDTLRAALLWVTLDLPEAVPSRLVARITGRVVTQAFAPVAEVSGHLRRTLERRLAATTGGAAIAPRLDTLVGDTRIALARTQRRAAARATAAVASDGWGVLASTAVVRRPIRDEEHAALETMLINLLRVGSPQPPLREARSILLDDAVVDGHAADLAVMLNSCVRWGVSQLAFNGRVLQLTVADRRRIEYGSRVEVGAGVGSIATGDEPTVTFRGFLSPYKLTNIEAAVVNLARREPLAERILAGLAAPFGHDAARGALRRLESRRVLRCRVDPSEWKHWLGADDLLGAHRPQLGLNVLCESQVS